MIVKAKLLGKKNERRVVGWDGNALRRVREGDEFEIPDDMIEVDEVIGGQKTGKKIKKLKYFSEKWMETVGEPVEVQAVPERVLDQVVSPQYVSRRGRPPKDRPRSTGDSDVI